MEKVENLVVRVEKSGDRYLEFLRVAPMSAGVYVLPAGAVDLQLPHEQDELYFVVRDGADSDTTMRTATSFW